MAEYALLDILESVPELRVTAIASRDHAKARQWAGKHRIEHVYSYDELVASTLIDAVYVPLPNSMHCDWTIKALHAGKAVLCEKPLASNALEAQRMVDAASRCNGILVEAFHWRYHPLCERLVEIVRSGLLGDLRRVDVRFRIPKSIVPADNIRWQYGLGGGCTMDTGCYCINFLRILLGEPTQVLSTVVSAVRDRAEGRMQAEMLFEGGTIGSIDSSQIDAGQTIVASAEVYGSEGTLSVIQPFVPQWGNSLTLAIGERTSTESFARIPTYVFQARAFANVLLRGEPIRTTAADGLRNMRVIDELYRAAGLPVRGGS